MLFKSTLSFDWGLIGFCLFHSYFLTQKMLDSNPTEIQCRIFFSWFQTHIHSSRLNNIQAEHDFLGHFYTKTNFNACANLYGICWDLISQIWFPQPDPYRRKKYEFLGCFSPQINYITLPVHMGNARWWRGLDVGGGAGENPCGLALTSFTYTCHGHGDMPWANGDLVLISGTKPLLWSWEL